MRDLKADEARSRSALILLDSKRNDRHEAALVAPRDDTPQGLNDLLAPIPATWRTASSHSRRQIPPRGQAGGAGPIRGAAEADVDDAGAVEALRDGPAPS